jgi:hypothetical protein
VWHRIGGDDDAAQVDPVQQRGERGDFVALRGDLTLGDHRLAGVERGGEQVHASESAANIYQELHCLVQPATANQPLSLPG